MPYCPKRLDCKNFITNGCGTLGVEKQCFEPWPEPEKAEVLASNSTPLLCCPFCGGTVKPCDCGCTCAYIICDKCGAFEMNVPEDTASKDVALEATKAFNNRAI